MEPELPSLAVQTARNGACDHMDLVAALSQSGCQGQRNDPAASQRRKAHDSDAQAHHQYTPSNTSSECAPNPITSVANGATIASMPSVLIAASPSDRHRTSSPLAAPALRNRVLRNAPRNRPAHRSAPGAHRRDIEAT